MIGLLTFRSLPHSLCTVAIMSRIPASQHLPTQISHQSPALSALLYQPVHIQQRRFLLLNHFAFFFFFLKVAGGGAGEWQLCVSEGEYL